MKDPPATLHTPLTKKPRWQAGRNPNNKPIARKESSDMSTLPELSQEIKASLEPTFMKDSIKKYRMELLAAPFSVSAYKLLLSLDLLLAEMEVS